MPDNPSVSSYANSIDPAGGIKTATTSRTGKPEVIDLSADFNASLPVTAEQLKSQEVKTTPSEQVAKTTIGQNEGPIYTGPFGETVRTGIHNGRTDKDDGRVKGQREAFAAQFKKPRVKGKAVVPKATLDKLKNINVADAMKRQFNERVQAVRTQQHYSPSRTQGRSI